MKLSRFAACLFSLLTVAAFTLTAAVPAFAEGDSLNWSDSDEIEPEDPEEPENPDLEPEPEETEPEVPEPEDPEPEDPEEEEPAAALDADDPPPAETTAAATTAAPSAPLPSASYTPEAEQTMYAPQVINIRSGPGTDYDKLGVLYANSEITVIGSSGEWAAVSYNGSTGYILRSLLSSTPPTTTAAAPETAPPQNEDTAPAEQTPPPETAPTESDRQQPEIAQPAETTAPAFTPEESTTTRAQNPATNIESADGGLPPFLLALLSAAAAFLLIGVLPVLIHRVHHKNLYRY